jgi:DNA mismatch repair protein MutH
MATEQLSLIDGPPPLTRAEAVERLEALIGEDLRPLVMDFGITVWKDGNRNKGWAGQVVEKYLGRSPNSDKAADFGDWELKVVPLVVNANGDLRPKESMAIAMFTQDEIEEEAFEESHLLEKLGRLLVVARLYVDSDESASIVLGMAGFDLDDPETYQQIVDDYEEIRWVVREEGIHAVGGHLGTLIQPRVKGGAGAGRGGHGFYARASFVGKILGI